MGIFLGDSLAILYDEVQPQSVDLVMTVRPLAWFGKRLRNVAADKYVEWFRPFAAAVRRVLKAPRIIGR